MIQAMHDMFRQWAEWEQLPVGGRGPGGVGVTITYKLMEGKGEFLPGAPRGSGPVGIPMDPIGMTVDRFLRTQKRKVRHIVFAYYLKHGYTVEERAAMVGLTKPKLYTKLHEIHLELQKFVNQNEFNSGTHSA